MATYDYECPKCGTLEEVKHGMLETPSLVCDVCSTKLKKTISIKYDQVGKYWEGASWEDIKLRIK